MTLQIALVQRGTCDKCGFTQEIAPVHDLINLDLTCPACEIEWTPPNWGDTLREFEKDLDVGD